MLEINTEIRKTNVNKLKALADKSTEIKQQFVEARERVQAEIASHQTHIQEQQRVLSEVYEEYVLDLKTLDEFRAEQEVMKTLQETLQTVQGKLESLDAVQKRKIDKLVYQPMREVAMDAGKEKAKIFSEKRDALLKAKEEYLKLVAESASALIQLEDATSVAISRAEVDAGYKDLLYTSGAVSPTLRKLTFNDTYLGGNPVITISEQEISKVYKV